MMTLMTRVPIALRHRKDLRRVVHLLRDLCVLGAMFWISPGVVGADAPDRPLRVLYLGPTAVGGGGGGSRTNYVYLPGQTLAPEAIYFDTLSEPTQLTAPLLRHYDAVVQARLTPKKGKPTFEREVLVQRNGLWFLYTSLPAGTPT